MYRVKVMASLFSRPDVPAGTRRIDCPLTHQAIEDYDAVVPGAGTQRELPDTFNLVRLQEFRDRERAIQAIENREHPERAFPVVLVALQSRAIDITVR
jgi:hypothetical protein